MKKLDAMLLKIYLWGLPAVVVLGALSYNGQVEALSRTGGYLSQLNNLTGLVFGVWMALTIYLSIRLMLSEGVRDKVLTKMTFIKERDEREIILTGQAIKTTYLTSMAILIFLFFLSCFQISIYRVPPEKAVNGKTGVLTLGFGFSVLENSKKAKSEEVIKQEDIFTYSGLPVSSSTVILALIIWQIGSYNYMMRRLTR
ncbi:MAG: hypothetical protein HQK55_09025 [Deltaproteobacteria bacterium]|nr:hypothetical protein [Deltaproteobacteria bacterium]